MKINGSITFLINRDKTRIEIQDGDANITFISIELTPEQLSSALSRLACTPCESMEVRGLQNVGKVYEYDTIVFEIPEGTPYGEQKKVAIEVSKEKCPEGWTPSEYFGSQNSFFYQDKKMFARCNISRWVDKEK